ncbi:hypothetical protein IscW_ISCW006928, partial [Ixodes scapularis]
RSDPSPPFPPPPPYNYEWHRRSCGYEHPVRCLKCYMRAKADVALRASGNDHPRRQTGETTNTLAPLRTTENCPPPPPSFTARQ